ncbi:MAG: DUF4136 domain-containing protein [Chitinophagaceae bacterium]
MKYLKSLVIALISTLIMAGCASVAHVERDNTVNFSNYKTFDWVEAQRDSTTQRISDLAEQNIKNAVNAELIKKGWRQSNNNPDVLLTYDVSVENTVREQNNPVYTQPYTRYYYNPYTRRWNSIYYPSQFAGYDRQRYQIREGTITISIVDAKTDKTVWQGWTTEALNSRNLTGKEIQQFVKSIFRKFNVAG